jgi:dipeptidyl aminopeptidase/acylaminoacyl peptidase
VFRDRITPHWFHDNTRFWYRNDLRDGAKEFVLVDTERGTRELAFDHAKLAKALSRAAGTEYRADKLPFESIDFTEDGRVVRFKTGEVGWRCDLASYEVREDPSNARVDPEQPKPATRAEAPRRSTRTGEETFVTFANRTAGQVELFWLDTEGARQSYGQIAPGGEHRQHTFAGHVWLVVDAGATELLRIEAGTDTGRVEITGAPQRQQEQGRQTQPRRPRRSRDDAERASDSSPDGRWTAFLKDHNVFIKSTDDSRRGENDAGQARQETRSTPPGEAKEIQLSTDGKEGLAYGRLAWAPDSKTLVAWRIEPGERREVYLIQSSPPGGGRAKMTSRPYALPSDKFATYELNLFDVAGRKQTKPEVDRFEHEWLRPRLRWMSDGRRFAYQQTDRGHQRFRVIEVDAHTGAARNLIDERSKTFIWTAHTENVRMEFVNWLTNSEEIIYASESNGWRHLYLIDASAGRLKNAITTGSPRGANDTSGPGDLTRSTPRGEWIVRGIDRIDETNRQVWFTASGVFQDQDPYLIHYGRVNFDGTGLTWLTAGDGNHSIAYSPDRKFIIDAYSRVDLPPVHELRRVSDGRLVCKLEEADSTALRESGWEAPEVFVAKGRDSKTDIWGVIRRPRDFDPNKKYPVIEDIYAGPQSSFVPKTFSPSSRYESLTRLGFIVVKIDGMGTANRSKSFHDVCWHNLKDAGFEDRILWMKAAAAKYPSMDLTRVGVYGNSAGGQNAAAAVLFHPDFYKIAVASCGCHDNRMDKASWNEQWMGYLPPDELWSKDWDNWYSRSSNIDNAHRLEGKLFLIVGELDNNVPPESTMRFVDALIKAGKDFDLLVVPGGGHGMGGSYGQRRMNDFFVRHLLGKEPPDRNGLRADESGGEGE